MKKSLVSALTAALVVGAASTTFAAANPFSDVPTDSWAYDAVTQLAADGVIEGYGDGTFRGQTNITRYEMAQMVAKAMAKDNVSAADKALINKLAAEFSDELNNLGVRVSNLERNADMLQWHGQARYTYSSSRHDSNIRKDGRKTKDNANKLLLRMEPSAEVNEHWHIKTRFDATTELSDDSTDTVKLKRIWAQGDYKNFRVKLGKFTIAHDHDNAMMFNDAMSGAEVTVGPKSHGINVQVAAGRINLSDETKYDDNFRAFKGDNVDKTANMQSIAVNYNQSKFKGTAAYYHLNSDAFKNKDDVQQKYPEYKYANGAGTDDANIWEVAAKYSFDRNVNLQGAFAQNTEADVFDNAWMAQLNYKGAQNANVGTWGFWAGYRRLGANVAFDPTTKDVCYNQKGWFVGTNYTLFKNTVGTLRYFNGKDLYNNKDAQQLWARVQFFF